MSIPFRFNPLGVDRGGGLFYLNPFYIEATNGDCRVCFFRMGNVDALDVAIKYSLDNKYWNDYTIGDYIEISNSQRVYFFNSTLSLNTGSSAYLRVYVSTGYCNIGGNLASLINYSNDLPSNCFYRLFYGSKVVDASNLVLPWDVLSYNCFCSLFEDNYYLITAPLLPATTLADSCYYQMFTGCQRLTTAPLLPATTLASYCYAFMFRGCYELVSTPVLAATNLESGCYSYMFSYCTKLCNVSVKFTDWLNGSTDNWLINVAAEGTFDAPSDLLIIFDQSHIPANWFLPNATDLIYVLSQTFFVTAHEYFLYYIKYTTIPDTMNVRFYVVDDSLPMGLYLDSFSGMISGLVDELINQTVRILLVNADGYARQLIDIEINVIEGLLTEYLYLSNECDNFTVSQRSTKSSYDAWLAMDGNENTYAQTQYQSGVYDWWMIQFNSAVKVNRLQLDVQNEQSKNMTLQGSNDGESWDDLLTDITGNSSRTSVLIDVDNTGYYTHYRLICSVKFYYLKIYEVRFYYLLPSIESVEQFKITSEGLSTNSNCYDYLIGWDGWTYNKNYEYDLIYFAKDDFSVTLRKVDDRWQFLLLGYDYYLLTYSLNPFDPNNTWYCTLTDLSDIVLKFLIISTSV